MIKQHTNLPLHRFILRTYLLNIVHSVLGRLYPLPASGQALLLQGVTPVSGLGVVVDVVLAAPQREVYRPPGRQRHFFFLTP